MTMGRPNKGLEHLDKYDVSEQSQLRGRVVMQTITGELSVEDACEQLGIDRSRFWRIRDQALQWYLESFEPGRPGRPRKRDVETDKKEQDLRDRVAQLEHELRLSEARANLAGLGQKKAEAPPRRMSRQERRRKSRE